MSYSDSLQIVPTTELPSPIMKKSKVCRCLFGRPDRESASEIRDELKKQMDDDLGVAKLRWGFDFEEDAPLRSGPYDWAELPSEDVPSFYTDPKPTYRRTLKAARNPSLKLRRNLQFSEEIESNVELSFSAERLRAKSKQNSDSSSTADLSSTDLQENNIAPIKADITTPCMKKLNNLEVSDKSKMDLTKSDVSRLTCAISKPKLGKEDSTATAASVQKFSGATCTSQPVGEKPKVQSSIRDFLKVRKRKASYSLSSNKSAKSLRRL